MVKSPTKTVGPAIWCLFSVDCNYDQPENNLVAWWFEKPTLETLFNVLKIKMGERDVETVFGVHVFTGAPDKHPFHDTLYRLEEVSEGVVSGGAE